MNLRGTFGVLKGVLFIVMRCAIWYHLYNLKNVEVTFNKVAA